MGRCTSPGLLQSFLWIHLNHLEPVACFSASWIPSGSTVCGGSNGWKRGVCNILCSLIRQATFFPPHHQGLWNTSGFKTVNHKISYSFNTPCQALGPFGVFSLNRSRGGQRRPPNKNGLELGPEKWIASQEGDHGRIFQAKRRLGTKVWAWRRVCCIWGTKSCPDAWAPKESEVASTDGQAGRGWGREDLVGVHKEEGAPSHRLSTPP